VALFYGIVLNRPKRFRRSIETKTFVTEQVMRITRKLQLASEGITSIIRRLNLPIPQPITEYTSLSILSGLAVEAFSKSDPTQSNKGGSLGGLAISLVQALTIEPLPEILFENPLLHAYGSVEQSYLDLLKEARRIDTVGMGEWDISLKSMTIPLDDSIFVESRSTAVNSVACSVMASNLISQLRMLAQYPSL